ncbi:FxLYD domain-containing protein [Natrialbaceae archaeon GCM10025810]|uniref:FxLYD domain-containing protein n=1 Tax=Halovalidus salilacus TaxID=3075124 RepID=UPI00361D6293
MYRRTLLGAGVAVGLAAVAPGCADVFDDDDGDITDPVDVEIVRHDLVRDERGTDEERVVVWGVVKNLGERPLSYVEIRATFYDDEGEELDSVLEYVEEEIPPGDEQAFSIEYPHFGEDAAAVADYELEPATGV